MAIASAARADEPRSYTFPYSPYERETIEQVASSLGATVEERPEGMTIEAIESVRLPVFEPRDPVPNIVNVFHWTSRDYTIRREVLVHEGEPWRKVLVDETARNLRALQRQLSLVIVVPLRGSRRDSVRLLVITKDVWSLRLNWSAAASAGGGIERLVLRPSEQNVFGTHHDAALEFELLPLSYALGASYSVPWTFGSRVATSASSGVYVQRERGAIEGGYGLVHVGQPLWSTRTEWAWGVGGSVVDMVSRRYVGGRLKEWDDPKTTAQERVPAEYRASEGAFSAGLLRSFGWAYKLDLTVGAEVTSTSYRLQSGDVPGSAAFAAVYLPTSETRVGPFLQVHTYSSDFLRTKDLEVLGLQEDFRLGPNAVVRLYPISSALGSSRDIFGTSLGLSYTFRLGDGFARLSNETHVETGAQRVSDAMTFGAIHIASPSTGVGRIVFDARAQHRFRNYLRRFSSLGGETRPRGYPSRWLYEEDYATWTLELRTRPLSIMSTQWGLVGFFDQAAAWTEPAGPVPYHAAGLGLRIGTPQLDRVTFRLDLGIPIMPSGRPSGVAPVDIVFSVGQAFSPPEILSSDSRTLLPTIRP